VIKSAKGTLENANAIIIQTGVAVLLLLTISLLHVPKESMPPLRTGAIMEPAIVSRSQTEDLPSANVIKHGGDRRNRTDNYLVFKPQQPERRKSTAGARRSHPWGPEAQGLPEVQTQAGDTVTMGSSALTGLQQPGVRRGFYKTPSQRMLAEELARRRASGVAKALRLDQEEEDHHFDSLKIRRGIENARRNSRMLPAQHWKTPYEVDAPRTVALPQYNPADISSSEKSVSTAGSSLAEKKIWRGIEQLMAEAFSDDTSSTGSCALPEELLRVMSRRSLETTSDSQPLDDSFTTASKDELEMAQAALTSFMDMLMPTQDELADGDLTDLPSLDSYHTSLDASIRTMEELEETENALNSFMDYLMEEVERTHKPSTLQLLDVFSWTVRVNVDADERFRYLEQQEKEKREKEMEIQKRHEELLRQREAEEAELMRLEEEGRRIEEMLKKKVEEAARLIRESENQQNDAHLIAPDTPAGRRRADSVRRQMELEAIIRSESNANLKENSPKRITETGVEEQVPPGEISSTSAPNFSSSSGMDTHTHSSNSGENYSTRRSALMMADPKQWGKVGGAVLTMPSDDEGSIDPTTLEKPGSQRRNSASAAVDSRTQVYSSTELQRRRASEAANRSSGTFSTQSVPSLMPSESKRSMKAAMLYEESELSIDPSTLPSLAHERQPMNPTASVARENDFGEQGPHWAAIGGRPIVMPMSDRNAYSTASTNGSPDSEVLPSSFIDKNKLSSSGSSTIHTLSTKQYEMSSVHTDEDLPDLKSLSETSNGTSSDGQESPKMKQTNIKKGSLTYPPRAAEILAKKRGALEKQTAAEEFAFNDSFVKRGHIERAMPPPKQEEDGGFFDSFEKLVNMEFQESDKVANAGTEVNELKKSSSHESDTSKKKKKKKKKKRKKRAKIDRAPSQRNLVVSAAGDVFIDDLQPSSLEKLPRGHFDQQVVKPDFTLSVDGSSDVPSATGVKSVGSAGDIHLGSAIIHISEIEEESVSSDDITIDNELRLDEIRMEGRRRYVPESKDEWKHKGRRASIGNLCKSITSCFWVPLRRNQQPSNTFPHKLQRQHSNADRCLLHEENETFDRSPVM
jgi:hypothetical protein